MGEFSDRVRKMSNKNRREPTKDVEFECSNCMNSFTFEYINICLNKSGDIEFKPEPTCPRCGSTVDLIFSDFAQEKIENMLFSGQIKRVK